MSEVAPRKVRGAIVSGYQFCITLGLLLAACVVYGTQNRRDSGSYRIPIAIQLAWALVLGRYFKTDYEHELTYFAQLADFFCYRSLRDTCMSVCFAQQIFFLCGTSLTDIGKFLV